MHNPIKTVYFKSYDDDFAGTNIDTEKVGADFPYIHKNPVWRTAAFCLYHIIARPLVWIIAKLWLGVRIQGRENIRGLDSPYFLYGNHTHILDVLVPNMITRHRRAHIIAGADAVSIKGLYNIVQMLGAIPLPCSPRGMLNFRRAIKHNYEKGRCITVYPEAHIWPYCAFIRPFPDTSFVFPAELGAPVVAMVTVYRRRTGLFAFCKKPAMSVNLSAPFYADPTLSRKEQAADLRSRVFRFMDETSKNVNGIEYIRYKKQE